MTIQWKSSLSKEFPASQSEIVYRLFFNLAYVSTRDGAFFRARKRPHFKNGKSSQYRDPDREPEVHLISNDSQTILSLRIDSITLE